jgi:hypothetical protein
MKKLELAMAPPKTLAVITLYPGDTEVTGIARWLSQNPDVDDDHLQFWFVQKFCERRADT